MNKVDFYNTIMLPYDVEIHVASIGRRIILDIRGEMVEYIYVSNGEYTSPLFGHYKLNHFIVEQYILQNNINGYVFEI